jgi:hypothetical protein
LPLGVVTGVDPVELLVVVGVLFGKLEGLPGTVRVVVTGAGTAGRSSCTTGTLGGADAGPVIAGAGAGTASNDTPASVIAGT